MWLEHLILFLALTAATAEQPSGPQATVSASSEPIATRQKYFSIPFRVDQPTDASKQPVEVQLFVSHDHGAHWQFYTRAAPNQKQIPFRTASDGEYWFAIRTVNREGKFTPETITGPGLRVVVDTTPPTMLLSAERGKSGQINVRWQINEPHLKAESLSLQYRSSPNGAWQAVAISGQNSTVKDNLQTGQVSWWPQAGSDDIQIRAEIADTAGNKSVSHAQLKNDKTADQQTAAVVQDIKPQVGSRYQASGESKVEQKLNKIPPGERPRMINTRTFELDYELETVGPSGVSRVALWGTSDGGRNWRLFALDDDNRSPISVTVDEEGIYGFRIVATSGAGLAQDIPKSGDLPAILIGVDLTKPSARIVSAELGKGKDEGHLFIAWEASDNLLTERPVTLSYSQNPAGPWTTIATGLENTGRYDWTIDSRAPALIYLRLEVRDEAGNLAVQDSKDPLALDQLRPSVKIREVRPVSKSGKM
jgi:hypothetical protein